MNKLLIICGPTAVGKTRLALKLAKKFPSIIISADSRQVYQGMDIGTGKDQPKKGPKIHGLDLVKPDQAFSVAHFTAFARPLIKKTQAKGQLPILVGGTGLYLKAIVKPFDTIGIKPHPKLRRELSGLTVKQLQTRLKKLDPARFKAMNHSDQRNPRRLIRAIEISRSSLQGPTLKVEFDTLWLGLKAKKSLLDQNIVKRVDQRLKQGAQKEVETLLKQGYSWSLSSLSAMGYQQWQPFFAGQAGLKEVRAQWIKAEQQYLRRQLTWFKAQPHICWFDLTDKNLFKTIVNQVQAWYT